MKALLVTLLLVPLMSFRDADLKPVDAEEAVSFSIKNFGIATKGSIKGLKGTIRWDAANPAAAAFNITLDVNTINTGITSRDNHLKKPEYFDVAKYPVISFASTSISKAAEGFNVTGNLTIKGVTKQVSFPFTAVASNNGFLFEGEFTINRKDYNVGGSSMVLGNDVKVTLKVPSAP